MLAMVFDRQGKFERALEYKQQALDMAAASSDARCAMAAHCNIGIAHQRFGRYGQAIAFFSPWDLGACRRRTPRTRVDLKVPEDASHPDRSDATLRSELALGVRRGHAITNTP